MSSPRRMGLRAVVNDFYFFFAGFLLTVPRNAAKFFELLTAVFIYFMFVSCRNSDEYLSFFSIKCLSCTV